MSWTDGVELRVRLQGAGPLPSDDEAARTYRATPAAKSFDPASDATLPPWTAGRVFLFHILRLAHALPAGLSLVRYLRRCRMGASSEVAAVIDPWLGGLTPRLPAASLVQEPARPSSEEPDAPCLQLRIGPLQLDHETNKLCFPAIAWWRSRTEQKPRMFEEKLPHHPHPEFERIAWEEFVNRAFQAALARAEGAAFCVEVILPLRYFACDIDFWNVADGRDRSPLGRQYPVVIRPYERLYEPAYLPPNARWQRKWRQWQEQPDTLRIWHDDEVGFFSELERGAVGVVAWTLDPMAPGQPAREDVIEEIIRAGVPAALCWRRPSRRTGAADDFRNWLGYDLHRWPQKIWEYRNDPTHRGAEWPGNEWPPLTLLWDSPDRLPPTRRAEGPAERES